MFQMWDKRSIINLTLLALYAAGFNFYLYELFLGSWDKLDTKIFYYGITIVFLTWLTVDDYFGYLTYLQKTTNLIGKISILINFLIIIFTLNNKLNNPIAYFVVLNCSNLLLTVSILISGCRHGYFKK